MLTNRETERVLPGQPRAQGDIVRIDYADSEGGPLLGVVINADCDLANGKLDGVIAYLRLLPFEIRYTRYADDLTFSTNCLALLEAVDLVIETSLRNVGYERLALNAAKTEIATVPNLGAVTGVMVDGHGGLSAGNERKQAIIDGIGVTLAGDLEPEELGSLKGSLAFVLDIEPDFRDVLDEQFGRDEVEWLRRYRPPGGWAWEQRA